MQLKYAQYLEICENMHMKYAKICKNMDSMCKNMQKKMQKYALKYAQYAEVQHAEVHILHISHIYSLPTLLIGAAR